MCEGKGNRAVVPVFAIFPGARGFLDRMQLRGHGTHLKFANWNDLALVRCRKLISEPGDFALSHDPLHVGLPGSHPNFSNEDIDERFLLASFFADDEMSRLKTGLELIQFNRPLTVLTRRRGFLLACKFNSHLRPRLAPPPNRNRHPPLEDGMVVEGSAELDREFARTLRLVRGTGSECRKSKSDRRGDSMNKVFHKLI